MASSAAVIYVVLGPTLVANSGSPLQVAFSVAYPAGDMVLLVGLASLLLRGSAPSARWALRLLTAGLLLFVVGDLVYGYVTLHSSYQTGDPIDTTWMVALALMAVAGATQPKVGRPERIEASREGLSWLPTAAVAFGFGVLLFSQRHEPIFPGVVMTMVALVLAALVSARQILVQRDLLAAQAQLRYQAFHDTLTELPNRPLVLDRAEQLVARGRREHIAVTALYLDVDGFKQVNDGFGHAVGDALLRTVAHRLTSLLRETDTVGRIGGDEFVILLDPTGPPIGPEVVAERVLTALRAPFDLGVTSDEPPSVTASIGIATGSHASADELLRNADIALYRAKERGRDCYALFESGMETVAEDNLQLEMGLRDAIEKAQFFLLYQPTFDLRTNAVSGVEALIRWRHPSRGTIEPDQFVPIAERSGMIIPIGRWVLVQACLQAAAWNRAGLRIGIAVNVSGRQLDSNRFLDDVNEALEVSEIDPATLTLEITETSLMRDPDGAGGRLAALKELGIRITIDDFGTGYSSLAYLRRFPVDTLKIDRSFIAGIATSDDSAAIVHSLVQLGKTLGLETLGEGVEEPDQLLALRREECDLCQGFLIAHPLDVEGIEQFFEDMPAAGLPVRELDPASA
jgi:diguanylate cyclase (GGDEF)-like protein